MINKEILEQIIGIVGEKNIYTENYILEQAEQTNYITNQKITAIIFPNNLEELKKCLLVANIYKIPIYPISKGKNWGYGSKVPVQTNSLIIDLSKINKILDYNEELGYVAVEPGVTFQQLFDFLREKNSNLIISVTGSSKESSLIGNTVDRGIGTGLYADRFSSVCNVEVMLPNGEIINTGFGRFGNSVTANVYRWGIGPVLDGLFSQSNLGIVTKMTFWLMPIPNYFQLIFYRIKNKTNLSALVDKLRSLSLDGLIRPTMTIYNDLRIISTVTQYPWSQFSPDINSPESVLKLLKEKIGISDSIGLWNGEISIRSITPEHGKIQYDLIKQAIQDKVDDISIVEVSKDEILSILKAYYDGNYQSSNNSLKEFLLGKYIGIPNDIAIKQAYWRKRKATPEILDPDKDKCGMIWICPVVPFTGVDIEKAIDIIEETIIKYSFEPSISCQCMSERAISIIASISWDREIISEDKSAIECYNEVTRKLRLNGYYSYRSTTLEMEKKNLDEINVSSYDKFLKDIKNTIDPQNIISPGRYI